MWRLRLQTVEDRGAVCRGDLGKRGSLGGGSEGFGLSVVSRDPFVDHFVILPPS